MEITFKYSNLAKKQQIVSKQEALGLRMLHDDFDAGWQYGDKPRGTLTFTDEQLPPAKLSRDLAAEIDILKDKITLLEDLITR